LLGLFYLTATEWVHVQPDIWMFLPALAAFTLRARWATAHAARRRESTPVLPLLIEGLLWGAACLVKPFVVVPGAFTWLASLALTRQSRPHGLRATVIDTAGLAAGGLLAGAAWQGWLLASGALESFWHNFAEFRSEYFTAAMSWGHRSLALFVKMPPWGLVHLVALPVAIALLGRLAFSRLPPPVLSSLLAAFYLGWLIQATYLQYQADYHLVPATMLALVLTVMWLRRYLPGQRDCLVPAGLTVAALAILATQPVLRPRRLALWNRCWREAGSAELKDALKLAPGPTWSDLERVTNYLRDQNVGDGDVLGYDFTTTPVVRDLGIRPASRFLYPATYMFMFSSKRSQLLGELQAGPQRYILTDAEDLGLSPDQAREQRPGEPLALPPSTRPHLPQRWPFTERIVFRAGRYFVHEAGAAPGQ
jgi:hypothetical protein